MMSVVKKHAAEQSESPELQQGFAAARAICRRWMREIALPAAFLPREKRSAVYSVLALAIMVREASSGTHELGELIHATLDQISSRQLQLPLPEMRSEQQNALFAATKTCEKYQVPVTCFIELADSLRSAPARFATWPTLQKYCAGAGGSVAAAVSAPLGLTHSDGASRASMLGTAIELTRILRDFKRDFDARQRIFVPLADMAHAKYSERDLANGLVNEPLRDLIKFECDRARTLFNEASLAIEWLADNGSRLFAASIVATGLNVLDSIEARWSEIHVSPVRVTTARIVRSLPRAWGILRGVSI